MLWRGLPLLTLAVFVTVAGCAGWSGPSPATPTTETTTTAPTTTPSPTPTSTPTTTRCSPSLVVERVPEEVEEPGEALSFSNVSLERRAEFVSALSNGPVTIDRAAEYWTRRDSIVVDYNNDFYEVDVRSC